MIELYLLKNATDLAKDPEATVTTLAVKQGPTMIAMVIYLVLFVWAIMRASRHANKALHLLFAVVSPFWYLVFSYFVPDFH